MGLDSYLSKKTYVAAMYEHRDVQGKIDISIRGDAYSIDLSRVSEITEQIAYWRKANHIHKWFVDNCADGTDDCEEVRVSIEKIEELLTLCKAVLNHEIDPRENLSTVIGFFFGDVDYGDWYYNDIKYTVGVLEEILKGKELPDVDYYYRASW
jgi:hypothetical protein